MGISRGDCKLHLSEHHGDASPGDKNYKYYHPGIHRTEWHTVEMSVQDGFGNKLIFFRDLPRP